MTFLNFQCFLLLIAVLVNSGLSQGQQPSLIEIQQKSFGHISQVKSLAYEGRVELLTGAVWRIKMERSGNKYRLHRIDEKPSLIQGEEIVGSYQEYAFDGLRHQAMDERESTMQDRSYIQLSDKQYQNGVNDLLLRPFQWLASSVCVSLDWSEVQSVELWNRQFAVAVDRGEIDKDGERFRVVEFPQKCSDSQAVLRVYFAIDHDYYPFRYDRLLVNSADISSTYVLDEFKVIRVANGSILVPIRGSRTEYGTDGTKKDRTSRFFLFPDTLLINTAIADSRFTLVPSKKPLIYDLDEEERLAKQSSEAKKSLPAVKSGSKWNKVFFGINLFAAILVLWSIWRKRGA